MMVARPRETPPNKRWPASTSSPVSNRSDCGWAGAGACARAGTPASASRKTRIRRTDRIAGSPLCDRLNRPDTGHTLVSTLQPRRPPVPGSEHSDTRMVAFPLHSLPPAANWRPAGPVNPRIAAPSSTTMTPARQQRKSATAAARHARWPVWVGWALWSAALAALLLALASQPVRAAMTERIVTDPPRGLAMNGIDPVTYFTDAAPLFGRPDQEGRYGGVFWRFRNEGNKAAFMADPEVYMPRYGGYDPVALGRGLAVAGN